MRDLILAVNPGSSSTKLGLFRGHFAVAQHVERHDEPEPAPRLVEALPARAKLVRAFLDHSGVAREELAAVVGRGGSSLRPLESGTYVIDEAMLRDVESGDHGDNPTNIGVPLAKTIADDHGCPAFVVDPSSVDELDPVARYSGLSGITRRCLCDALNMRAAARRHASAVQRPVDELRLVVAHLGAGTSLAALREGRLIEVVNRGAEGPFSTDACGEIPVDAIIDLCFAPGATAESVRRRVLQEGGLYSYVGTRDLDELAQRAERGEGKTLVLLDAMAYQIAKCIGELAVALGGEVDAVLLTGTAAHATAVVNGICRRVEWIAPVFVYPGDDELHALAEGALRVLSGEERPKRYG